MFCDDKNIDLSMIASAVRAERLFDLKFNIPVNDFYRVKFAADRDEEKKLCKIIYKYE